MLQSLRDKTSGWIATAILGLIILAFALTGLPSMLQNTDTHVAKVQAPPAWWPSAPGFWPVSKLWEEEVITYSDFRTAFDNARERQRRDQGEAFDAREFESDENKQRVLDSLIDLHLQKLAARNGGVVVSDRMVQKQIMAIPAFQADGKFSMDRYKLALAGLQPSQTTEQFEASVRQELEDSLLPSALMASNFVTPSELDRLTRLLQETRDASLLMLPPPPTDTAPVSEAQIKEWYEKHAASYRAPETVTLEYVEINAADLTVPALDDNALRARYESDKKTYTEQEQRLASHILIKVDANADAAAQKAAEAKAKQIAAQAKAPGADFAALARTHSDDPGSKASGGDLGWNAAGVMVPEFDAAMFSLKPGEISAPVKSSFGWHIIQLREVKAPQQQPFEEVRDQLAREQAEKDRDRAYSELTGDLVDQILKDPTSLASAAQKHKLTVRKLGPVSRSSNEGILASPAVKRQAFDPMRIQDQTVTDPIDIAPNHSVMLRVVAHTPEAPRPLAQVRDQVIAAIHNDRTAKLAETQAQALLARLRKGETLAAIATEKGLPPPNVVPAVQRGMPMPVPAVSEAIFAAAAPTAGKPTPGMAAIDGGNMMLFTVDKVNAGDASEIAPAQREMIEQQLVRADSEEELRNLVIALKKRMKVEKLEANMR